MARCNGCIRTRQASNSKANRAAQKISYWGNQNSEKPKHNTTKSGEYLCITLYASNVQLVF
jgi:hypothetical protein